jgi:hypothetical protein
MGRTLVRNAVSTARVLARSWAESPTFGSGIADLREGAIGAEDDNLTAVERLVPIAQVGAQPEDPAGPGAVAVGCAVLTSGQPRRIVGERDVDVGRCGKVQMQRQS